jgi:hypothetical protein
VPSWDDAAEGVDHVNTRIAVDPDRTAASTIVAREHRIAP